MFNKLKSFFTRADLGRDSQAVVGSSVPSFSLNNVISCYRDGTYDNNFPNITRIAEAFAEVMPYAVDANGKRLTKNPHVIDVLYSPNEEMSGPEFWETLMVMMLVHPTVFLLLWRKEGRDILPGGPATKDNLAGFTFLEGCSVERINGTTLYYANGTAYTKDDVIALSLNVNPYSLLDGYSPSMAAKKWSTVDDYVADYQAGFFRNGAVPAGQMVVTARTKEEFDKIVDGLQEHHRGARNANNLIYTHRPTSAIDGKPLTSQIEWVPFAQQDQKGTLQSLFDQANKKIDMDFGVPQEVKGYLQNSNYASAEVADYVFSRRVLYPKLVKVWSKMTHQLNRALGGLGFAISFDYEVPVLTDTRKVQTESLTLLTSSGFTVESAVKALQLPSSFNALVKEESSPTESPLPEATEAPSEEDNSEKKSFKKKEVDLQTEEIWKAPANPELVAIMRNYQNRVLQQGITIIDQILSRRSGDSSNLTNEEISQIITDLQVWLEDSGYKQEVIDALRPILTDIIRSSGIDAIKDLAIRIGIVAPEFSITDEQATELERRLVELIESYGQQTIDEIKTDLDLSLSNGLSPDEVRALLLDRQNKDEYRAERWARSEEHHAMETGVLIAAIRVSEAEDLEMYKTWRINPASPDVCIECYHLDGETVRIDEKFSNGDMVPHDHPHCYCTMEITYRRKKYIKAVKILCPNCGRYMMESTGGVMKNVICANGKCKKHYDFEIIGEKIKTTERK